MSKIINNKKLRRREQLGNISLLMNAADIPPLLKRIYIQRGVSTVGELERSVRGLLTYHSINGIQSAASILVEAMVNQRKLMVVGDFDVDGATSTALMVLALQQMGANYVEFIVPNRFKNGYGLSTEVVEQAAARGTKIIVTVDNGISSHAGVNLANKKGIKVLITDHHIPGDKQQLPAAEAIINPNICGCDFKSKSLAGVGVAFYLMLALRASLNNDGWFNKKGITVPNLAKLLDLVALGTIADVVPLDKNNRILVYQGINRIRAGYCRPGISALAEVVGLDSAKLSTNDLGFYIGPRLNAAGRLTDMSVGVTLLLTENLQQARTIAVELDALNHTRRKIEKNMEIDALKFCCNIEKNNIPYGLVMYHAKWHQGVVGIIASKIKELFHRPVIAFAYIGKGLLKGSGRSVSGLHMRDLLERINTLYPGIIIQFGGHAMAVGLTLKYKNIYLFSKIFKNIIKDLLDPTLLEGVVWSDGELVGNELSCTTVELIRYGGPWGHDFPEPIFDGRFNIKNQKLVGEKHLKLMLEPIAGGPLLDGIAFNINSNIWPDNNIHTVELAYKLDIKEFRGNKSLQLLIQHIWPL